MKKTQTLLALGAALSALSSPAALAAHEIGELRELYDSGKVPAASDVQAVWIGRCFLDSETGNPVSGAMWIGKDPSDRSGPLFPGGSSAWFRIAEGRAQQFDDFNAEKDALPTGSIDSEGYPRNPATVEEGAYTALMGEWDEWTSQWKIRKSGDSLIALQYLVKPKRETARRIALKRACYFFKKVF